MKPKKKVVAIVCADIHLKHKPPICRWGEDDWYAAMRRALNQIHKVWLEYNVPILYAGDIFDRWNPPPQLINFAIKHLPKGFAVPGQHDLPYHDYNKIEHSAYWTLCKAGVLSNLDPSDLRWIDYDKVVVVGYPWGFDPKPISEDPEAIQIAVVHKLAWHIKPFPNAPQESYTRNLQIALSGFDVAVFGDNHQHFIYGDRPLIYNCGSLMRITADQIKFQPKIGLIWSDKSVSTVDVDISQDKFLAKAGKFVTEAEIPELKELAQEFSRITKRTVSFMEYLEDLLKQEDLSDEVKQVIINAMEVSKKC